MGASIRITLQYFSHVRHVLGRDEEALDLPPGSTVQAAEARVREMANGRLDGMVFRLAVNHEYVPPATELADGDEVALISPVQGG